MKNPVIIAQVSTLKNKEPEHALVNGLDLVIVKFDDDISVLYGRCLHRGALMSDGHIDGHNLICGVHGWDYRVDSGVSEYNNKEVLHKFSTKIEGDDLIVDAFEIDAYLVNSPQPFNRDEYLGLYESIHPTPEEDKTDDIQQLAKYGLTKVGHHGPVAAMGVGRNMLPKWDDIQILPAQLSNLPHLGVSG